MLTFLRELRYPKEFRVSDLMKEYIAKPVLSGGDERVEKLVEDWLQGEEVKAIATVDVVCHVLRDLLHNLKEEEKIWSDDELVNIARVAWIVKKKIDYYEKKYSEIHYFQNVTVCLGDIFDLLEEKGVEVHDPEGKDFDPYRRDIKPSSKLEYDGEKKIYLVIQEPAIYINEKLKHKGLATIGIPKNIKGANHE